MYQYRNLICFFYRDYELFEEKNLMRRVFKRMNIKYDS